MPRPLLALSAFLVALPLLAEDPAAIARRVHDATVEPAPLIDALRSNDGIARATAARVALVRSVTATVPALREALAKETHHDAAREQVRALVLLGSDEDVAFAAQQLPRYPTSIDGEFGDAMARIGGQRAVDLYFRHAPGLRMPAFDTLLLFWDNEALIPATATRALEAGDYAFWGAMLGRTVIAGDAAIAALKHPEPKVRIDALWHLVEHAKDHPALLGAVREAAAPREGASVEESLARELVRRAAGDAPRDVPGAAAWLRAKENRQRVTYTAVERLKITEARTAQLIFLRDKSNAPCFDEDPLVNARIPAAALRLGGDIKAPKAKRRVEPDFPAGALRAIEPGASIPVLIESVISSTGCYRSFRLIRQARFPSVNRSALEALSKWKFEPGALDGVPVDVIFYLTINFKSR